ncbi:hypothetical protein, partial [Acinetobacter pittii]|uniref:hypothetical protein n=1 Tax=Acinetobacter pittii TaxID=48296 RepID=UPI0030098D4B
KMMLLNLAFLYRLKYFFVVSKRDRNTFTLKLSAKNRHAKAAQKKCARLSQVYCCYDFLVVTIL